MSTPCEYTLAEKPTIDGLVKLGYSFLNPDQHDTHRDGEEILSNPVDRP